MDREKSSKFLELLEKMQKSILVGDAHIDGGANWVAAKDNRSKEDQLSVYVNAYIWRLVDIIRDDYPCLEYLLEQGTVELSDVVERYVRKNPSRFRQLSTYGIDLPEYLREDEEFSHQKEIPLEMAEEVAKVESAMTYAFYAPDSEPLQAESLAKLTPDQFGEMSIRLRPSCSLLCQTYSLNNFVNEFYQEKKPSLPKLKESFMIVFRDKGDIWRMNLARNEYLMLQRLNQGLVVMDAISALVSEDNISPEDLMEPLETWFSRWIQERILMAWEEH